MFSLDVSTRTADSMTPANAGSVRVDTAGNVTFGTDHHNGDSRSVGEMRDHSGAADFDESSLQLSTTTSGSMHRREGQEDAVAGRRSPPPLLLELVSEADITTLGDMSTTVDDVAHGGAFSAAQVHLVGGAYDVLSNELWHAHRELGTRLLSTTSAFLARR